MEKIIGRLWHKDRAVNHNMNVVNSSINLSNMVEREIREQETELILPALEDESLDTASVMKAIEKPLERLSDVTDIAKKRLSSAKATYNLIKRAHPILLGPATLDSLVFNKPDDYDYIKNEQLPFKNMWFEFYDSIRIGLPFIGNSEEVLGIHFYPSRLMGGSFTNEQKYILEIYYTHKNKLKSMILACNPESCAEFTGSTNNTNYHICMDNNIINYTTPEDMISEAKKGRITFGTGTYMRSAPLDDIEDNGFFVKMANLCTNLINYINADNKEMVEMTREVQVKTTSNNKGKKKSKVEKRDETYSLIKIKSSIKYTGERIPTGVKWNLDEQIMVRGHDRKFKDEEEVIRKIIWIEPFRKGPEDAPWADQRHELQYEALQREKRMLETGERF